MLGYSFVPKSENSSVKVYGRNLRISRKKSVVVCRAINGMNFSKGKKLLNDMKNGKRSLGGKYYTKVSSEIHKLLELAESNSEFKGLDPTNMIIHASAHKGFSFWRPRRFKIRRTEAKMCNIQIVLTK